MADNTFRRTLRENSPQLQGPGWHRLDFLFGRGGIPARYLPRVLFLTVLLLLYIGNTHYTERTLRRIRSLQTEVEDLRADYITLKAAYMKASKQSEVAKRVAPLGLEESTAPPFKIIVPAE